MLAERVGKLFPLLIFVVIVIGIFILAFSPAWALFGNGIVSAGAKGIAPQDAPYREDSAYDKASFLIRLKGVGRASRREPTSGIRFQS